ncbi:MAG: HAMP domain-containing sensor histidine kinase [Bacillota bacterium]|nr:HAMP domain-containing sensor histidine kinase [Bacillota bacterium]
MDKNVSVYHRGKYEILYDPEKLRIGFGVYLLGLWGPLIVRPDEFGIYDHLRRGLEEDRCSDMILAALMLVMMNVVRMMPHYLGAFLIDESIEFKKAGKRRFEWNVWLTFGLILGMYRLIDLIHGASYDFGFPALFTVSVILLLSYMNLFGVSPFNKVIVVMTMLLSIQWLDVMPALTRYGFGRGEVSRDIKSFAFAMGEEDTLTIFAVCLTTIFTFASAMQIALLWKEHKLRIAGEETRRAQQNLYESRIEALNMRSTTEAQSLVHDLKSPLTTVQGLISLAEMMEENPLIREYFAKISKALSNMSVMISEILYENRKKTLNTDDLFHDVLAQVSITIPADMIRYENTCPEAQILGNRIRLVRAVINLVNNAYAAVDKKKGRIDLTVGRKNGGIEIMVQDNGHGMTEHERTQAFELGYSGAGSSGLGLAFTRQVITAHGGTIEIESEKNQYTRVKILLDEVREEEHDGNDGADGQDSGD